MIYGKLMQPNSAEVTWQLNMYVEDFWVEMLKIIEVMSMWGIVMWLNM